MKNTQEKNEIIVYQPSESLRLEVSLSNDTVWLSQAQMGELFGCSVDNIGLHLRNIYKSGELMKTATTEESSVVQKEGSRLVARRIMLYNLDAIISVGYRVNSIRGVQFRQWATNVLRDYLLRGYSFNARLAEAEDRIDRRLAKQDAEIGELKDKVDFFVKTSLPPVQGVFYDGQLWDACSLVERLIGRAKKSILLIDNWVGIGTLDMLAKKRKGVEVKIITSAHRDRGGNSRPTLAHTDIERFNAQYPSLSVEYNEKFHDRFLILDDKEIYLIGASLKDLGKKCLRSRSLIRPKSWG